MMESPREALLEPRPVGNLAGAFFVPAYQRGYRWGAWEVSRLLEDVLESGGEPYYLQPVVVKSLPDGRWELVDGQQRLTTLYLILKYMQDQGLQSLGPEFSLEYETRPSSRDYLDDPDEARNQENIDFFHIYEAYRCIHDWFEEHAQRKQYVANKFYEYLFETVHVIWYEAPADLHSTTLFTRLNIGQIPLTNAELVKALLLSHASGNAGHTDRSHEIAAEWDSFERSLRVPEVWAFATASADEVPTHISLLLDTLADVRSDAPTGRDRPLFHTFETLRPPIIKSFQDVWDDIADLHGLLLGWHDDRDLFHKIGYLTANDDTVEDLFELSRGKTKSAFDIALDERIRKVLNLSEADVRDLSYGSPRPERKSAQALLLMNVETVRQRKDSSERYSFRAHATGAWSLEHIHAQSAERLNRAEQWTEWLRLHRDALEGIPDLEPAKRVALSERIDAALADISEGVFRPLERELTELLSGDSDDDVDSIANLALLLSEDNSAFSNSVFEVKRREMLRRDREGSYIPVCTRNVFLKYYTDWDAQQIHFWGTPDRESYVDALIEALGPYLLPEDDAS